jgi:hypothetical protein
MKFQVYKSANLVKSIEAEDIIEAAKLAGLTEPMYPSITSILYGNFAWQWFTGEDGKSYAVEVIEADSV